MGFPFPAQSIVFGLILQMSIMIFGPAALAQDVAPADAHFHEAITLAEAGDAVAQNLVGTLTQFGVGVPPNPEAALGWYERAAAQGNPEAQLNLGSMYMDGIGTQQDFSRGVELLKLSADQGLPLAIARLGHAHVMGQGVPMNRREGIRMLEEASGLGDGFAAYQLGLVYLYGYNVPVDKEEAIRWFRTSAERGYAVAQVVYAQYLPEGPEQLSWNVRAANAGNAQAQYALGKEMLDQLSEYHDPEMAVAWLRLAAEGGNSRAEQLLFQMGLPGQDGRAALNRHAYTSTSREWSRQQMERAVISFGLAFGIAVILMDGPDTRPRQTEGSADCQPGGPCGGSCPFGHVLIAGMCVFQPPRF